MNIIKTEIPDLIIIEPKLFEDERGYFYESYNAAKLEENGINIQFVQDNQSKSQLGVIRGLHYQLMPYQQTKLIRAIEGTILDVVVDIRENSSAYGKVFSIELSVENKKQLLVPVGFAHGFSVLSPTAVVSYKCDNFYHPEAERGIHFNDPGLDIDWKISYEEAIVSPKDNALPLMVNAEMNFIFDKN